MNNLPNTVYIVDDDEIICKAIKFLLAPTHLEAKVFHDAFSFLKVYDVSLRGCLLIDVRMPGMSGLQLQEKLVALGNSMPIIMLTGHGDISMAVRALKAGAADFLTKPFNDQQLLEQVQTALLKYENTSVIEAAKNRYKTLNPPEQEIMASIIAGKMNKVIAYKLNISIKTIEICRANVMRKMQVKNLAELIKIHCSIQSNNNFL